MRGTWIGSIALLLGVLLAPWAERADAQQVWPSPGARVRVAAPEAQVYRVEGVLDAITQDSVVLRLLRQRPGSPAMDTVRLALALAQVKTLEVSRGQVSRRFRAVTAGCAVGTLAGIVVGASVPLGPSIGMNPRGPAVIGGAMIGAAGGALVGLVVGSGLSGERWERVPVTSGGRGVSLLLWRGGQPALGAALSF